jgi:hypothetical protein
MTILAPNGDPYPPTTSVVVNTNGISFTTSEPSPHGRIYPAKEEPKTPTIGDIADLMLKQMEQFEHSKKVALDAFVVANQEVEKSAAKVQAAKTPYGREYHTKKLVKQRTIALRAIAIADELEQRIVRFKEQVESLLEINKNVDENAGDTTETSVIEEAP